MRYKWNMKIFVRFAAATAAVLCLSVLPLAAFAAAPQGPPESQQQYAVDYNDWNYGGFAGDFQGTLTLSFYPDGTISGWYRPDYGGSIMPVVGGRTDRGVWLAIGPHGDLRVNARDAGGRLLGTATAAGRRFDFKATPTQ